MKIERKTPVAFEPVVVTIESPEEAAILCDLTGKTSMYDDAETLKKWGFQHVTSDHPAVKSIANLYLELKAALEGHAEEPTSW